MIQTLSSIYLTCRALRSSTKQIAAKVVNTCSTSILSSASFSSCSPPLRIASRISFKYEKTPAERYLHLASTLHRTEVLIALSELNTMGFANAVEVVSSNTLEARTSLTINSIAPPPWTSICYFLVVLRPKISLVIVSSVIIMRWWIFVISSSMLDVSLFVSLSSSFPLVNARSAQALCCRVDVVVQHDVFSFFIVIIVGDNIFLLFNSV